MDQVQIDDVSRRKAIQRGLGAIAVVAIVWVGRGSALAAPTKLAKTAVQYVDQGNVEGKDCDDCSQFVAGRTPKDPASCKIVEGDINPHGHCIAFSPKPKS
jgi:hypothetical protein